jgi:hypothetical protein
MHIQYLLTYNGRYFSAKIFEVNDLFLKNPFKSEHVPESVWPVVGYSHLPEGLLRVDDAVLSEGDGADEAPCLERNLV